MQNIILIAGVRSISLCIPFDIRMANEPLYYVIIATYFKYSKDVLANYKSLGIQTSYSLSDVFLARLFSDISENT